MTIRRDLGAIPNEECQVLLRSTELGRLAVNVGGVPYVVPISYRWMSLPEFDRPVAVLRVRSASTIDRSIGPAALLVDAIDVTHGRAWSVLARGELVRLSSSHPQVTSRPWVEGRDRLLCLSSGEISGRRFVAQSGAAGVPTDVSGFTVEWGFAAS